MGSVAPCFTLQVGYLLSGLIVIVDSGKIQRCESVTFFALQGRSYSTSSLSTNVLATVENVLDKHY